MNDNLGRFLHSMDTLVASATDPHAIADQTTGHLAELVRHPEFLEERYRQPADEHYRQHVVHVHPEGKYSLVSLVWRPGQATPIHDHRCWCVVGVLEGREAETRYRLYADQDEGAVLVVQAEAVNGPGAVCALVPPVEDIHRVCNAGDDDLTISLHVYGADIATLGSSINHTFGQPIVGEVHAGATPMSWRAGD